MTNIPRIHSGDLTRKVNSYWSGPFGVRFKNLTIYFGIFISLPSVHYDGDGQCRRTDGNTGITIIIVSIIKKNY